MYLTYEEYVQRGGTLDASTYAITELKAESILNWYTFNRLKDDTTIPTEVKDCIFILIDLVYKKDASISVGSASTTSPTESVIASQSNDGVSVSYNTMSAKDLNTTVDNAIKDNINMLLQGVVNSVGHKLLYRGLYADE